MPGILGEASCRYGIILVLAAIPRVCCALRWPFAMAASKKGINAARLKTIFDRQDQPRWFADYIPSILATPQEAPSISRASVLASGKFRRGIHLLSLPERSAAILALYCPWLVELHEQKMISPGPREHPSAGFPGVVASGLLPIKGLIDVAERLGYLHLLPRLGIPDPEDPSNSRIVVFPYIGDLLLFMQPCRNRQPYCKNWTIKDTEVAFKRPGPTSTKRSRRQEPTEIILARHQIEEVYYADAVIGTQRVAGDQIDGHVAANLAQLFGYHRRGVTIPVTQQEDIREKYRAAMESGIPPLEVVLLLCAQGKVSSHDCRTILFRAIWQRELRVDLFEPVLINYPLKLETRDVLDVYADWFRE